MKKITIAFFVLLAFIILIYNYFYQFNSGLNNSKWSVDSLNNTTLIENTTITLLFTDNKKITGNSSVNSYGCNYKLRNTLTFSECFSTEMASTDPLINEQETNYLSLLTKVKYYRKQENRLILLDINEHEIITLHRTGE